jgi:hypothetical protein
MKGLYNEMFIIFLMTILLVNFLSFSAMANSGSNYYVNKAIGNDENPGTIDKPFATITKASNVAKAGDTVYIYGGEYREILKPTNSGTSEEPITFTSMPNETVTISGCEEVDSNWVKYADNIYKTNVKLSLKEGNQIFFDDNMMIEARWPNIEDTKDLSKALFEPKLSTGKNGVELSSKQNEKDPYFKDYRFTMLDNKYDGPNAIGAKIWITTIENHGWCAFTGDITSFATRSKIFNFTTESFDPYWEQCKVSNGIKQGQYYLFGKLEFLDSNGEFFYDEKSETLYVYSENAPKNVKYKKHNVGIDFSNKEYVNVNGINLFGCKAIFNSKTQNCVIDSMTAKYISHFTTVQCNATSRMYDTGIILDGKNNTVRNSEIAYSAGNGIILNGEYNKVINNYIHDCNYLGGYPANIQVSGKFHIIGYNTVTSSGRSALTGHMYGCKIIGNELAYVNKLVADGGCLYVGFNEGGNTEIAYNYMHDHYSEERWGTGLYLDNHSRNYIIHNNYIEGLHLNGPRANILVANNTIFGSRGIVYPLWISSYNEDGIGTYFVNNISSTANGVVFEGSGQPIGDVSNWYKSSNGDPLLNKDGTLKEGSPAIDVSQAVTLKGINDNAVNKKPYIGAFEYGVPAFKYGHNFEDKTIDMVYTKPDFELMNKVSDASFESGELIDWQTNDNKYDWISKTGFKSIVIKPNTEISQVVKNLIPNKEYTFTAWYKGNTSSEIKLLEYGKNEIVSKNNFANDWTFNKIIFKPNNTTVKISFVNNGEQDLCVDDVGVVMSFSGDKIPFEKLEEPDYGIVNNGGFEQGLTGWFDIAAAKTSISNMEVHSGMSSAYVKDRYTDYSSIAQIGVPLENGKTYEMSAWVKFIYPVSNCKFFITLFDADNNQAHIYSDGVAIKNSHWTQLKAKIKINEPKPFVKAQIAVITEGGVNCNFFLDDVCVTLSE